MPGGGGARAVPVKITGYSEGRGFPPSSACRLNYGASPRRCINEILSAVYFSRVFFASVSFLHGRFPPFPSKAQCVKAITHLGVQRCWGDRSGPLALGSCWQRGRSGRGEPVRIRASWRRDAMLWDHPSQPVDCPRNNFHGCPGLRDVLCRDVLPVERLNGVKTGQIAGSCRVRALRSHWDRPSQARHLGFKCFCLLMH